MKLTKEIWPLILCNLLATNTQLLSYSNPAHCYVVAPVTGILGEAR